LTYGSSPADAVGKAITGVAVCTAVGIAVLERRRRGHRHISARQQARRRHRRSAEGGHEGYTGPEVAG
jgi:hypothetical protein